MDVALTPRMFSTDLFIRRRIARTSHGQCQALHINHTGFETTCEEVACFPLGRASYPERRLRSVEVHVLGACPPQFNQIGAALHLHVNFQLAAELMLEIDCHAHGIRHVQPQSLLSTLLDAAMHTSMQLLM